MSLKQGLALGACISLLAGCGGESSSGSSSSATKYFNVSFIELETQASPSSSCQIFGYDDSETRGTSIIGYLTHPSTKYSIVVHDSNGDFVERYNEGDGWTSSATNFSINQDLVPDNGYVSFVSRVTSGGSTNFDVTTIAKSLLPDSFSVYAGNGTPNSSCITGSNPTWSDYNIYLKPDDGYNFYGVNRYNQSTSDLASQYSHSGYDGSPFSFSSQTGKNVMAVRYATDENYTSVGNLQAFAFLTTSQLGSASNLLLDDSDAVDYTDNSWTLPASSYDITLSGANIYVDYNNSAFLWQPLDTSADGTFSYASTSDLLTTDYYLNITASQQANSDNWDIQAVIQSDMSSSLTVDDFMSSLPSAQAFDITTCTSSTDNCYITSNTGVSNSDLVMRLMYQSTLTSGAARHVIYADYSDELTQFTFSSSDDSTLSALDGVASTNYSHVSVLSTTSEDVENAFLYQHSNFYNMVGTDGDIVGSSYSDVDSIPLIQSYTNQLADNDLLKRTPYVWLDASY